MVDTSTIDDLFGALESRVALPRILNVTEEKIRFFNSGNTYNPQFTYAPKQPLVEDDFAPAQLAVEELEHSELRALYERKLAEYRMRAAMVAAIGNSAQDFTKQSIALYGMPKQESLDIAHKVVAVMPSISFGRRHPAYIRFKKLRKTLKQHLKRSKLRGKLVIRYEKGVLNNVAVSKVTGNVMISRNYIADADELTDIIFHELETHMRRLERGGKLSAGIFRDGTAGYLAYEEGMATLMGHAHKKNKNLWHPALLLLAMDAALHGSFADVFQRINAIIRNPFRSWSYAVRVKYGLSDTAQPGAFTKDMYLQWLIMVGRKLINEPELLTWAYNGKASFEELANFSQPWVNPSGMSVEDIQAIFSENFIDG